MMGSVSSTQKQIGALVVVIVLAAGLAGLVSVFPTASNQGYAPEQPIPFSHKLHAGKHKMDCRYCHTSADKSSHSNIPSMNVCMNCHTQVKTDSPHIQRLTKAYNEGRPIEWLRIHELPDFVRFNHQPHTRVGISCQTCHGPVEQMDVVYQYSPLTMGWCMQCHRGETTPREVLSSIHPDVEDPRGLPAASVGCVVCHY